MSDAPSVRSATRAWRRLSACWILAALATGCSSGGSSSTETNGANGAASDTALTPEESAPGVFIETDAEQAEPEDSSLAPECARDIHEGERAKINLHLLLDISGSMRSLISPEASRWHAVRDAIAEFISSPASAGIELALSYYPAQTLRTSCQRHAECAVQPCVRSVCLVELAFGSPVYCEPDSFYPIPALNPFRCTQGVTLEDGTVIEPACVAPAFCTDSPTQFCLIDEDCEAGSCEISPDFGICPGENSCDAADYATPAVPKQALPDGAMTFIDSLGAIEPDEFALTPTQVALAGAYQHTSQWIQDDPKARSFVVLATDGFPDGCEQSEVASAPDLTLAEIREGQDDAIDTFVIGVVDGQLDTQGQARAELSKMATAGGTGEAHVVTADESVSAGFLAALDTIRGTLPCEYQLPIPESGTTDLNLVNVEVKVGQQSTIAPRVDTAADCSDGERGWHYNGEGQGDEQIVLCPQTCQEITGREDAQVDVVLGCKTLTKIK